MTKLTFIAGGSKGLGAQLCNTFTNNKHHVYEFSRSGSGDRHIKCDFNDIELTDKVTQEAFYTAHQKQLSHINLIINTAILAPFGSVAEADTKTIKQHLNINIESTLLLLKNFISTFQDNPAIKTVAYISSGAARRPIPGLAMYSASKAFFERLIDTLAEEQNTKQHPMHCMTINPGIMNTDMQTEIRSQDINDFPMVYMWNEWHQQGKLADPKDIAAICYQLISHDGENGGFYTAQDYLT